MKRGTETDLVRACLEALQVCGIVAWRNNTQGVYDPSRQVFRSFTGRKGVADILGVIPPAGTLLAVETKSKTGRLRPEQRQFLEEVATAGGVALMVRSVGELLDELAQRGYGPGNRR